MARIDEIQRRVLADSEKAIELWRRLFGKEMYFTWEETPPTDFHFGENKLSKAIVQLVNETNEHLNQNVEPNRVGETSLFIREPHNDRLVLAHSTSAALREPDGTDPRIADWYENYDHLYYTRDLLKHKSDLDFVEFRTSGNADINMWIDNFDFVPAYSTWQLSWY